MTDNLARDSLAKQGLGAELCVTHLLLLEGGLRQLKGLSIAGIQSARAIEVWVRA